MTLSAKIATVGLTFDDVLIQPRYSEVVPSEVDVSTRLTARIGLNLPLLSSPMDTVTEHQMAIGLAQVGGLGVIHKNLPVDVQTKEVDKVKRRPTASSSTRSLCHPMLALPPPARRWRNPTCRGFPLPSRAESWWAFLPGETCVSWREMSCRSPT